MCAQFEILKVKVLTNFLGTVDFYLGMDVTIRPEDLRGSVTWLVSILAPLSHISSSCGPNFGPSSPRLGGYLARMTSLSSCGTLRLA